MTQQDPEPLEVVVALGGGAARGLSHVGILRVLEREGVKIRAVAGTSIGAIIGGIYCAGKLDEYEEYIRGMDAKGMLRLLDPVMKKAGLLGGNRMMKRLYEILGELEMSELDIPFTAVATDLHTGEEVRLHSGDLVEAMRASMAIPGVFTPVKLEDRWLVDGGVSMPVPVGAARAMAMGLPIIAVNLNNTSLIFEGEVLSLLDAPEAERELSRMERMFQRVRGHSPDGNDVPGMLSSVSDSVTHMEHRITRFQLAADPPDLLLEPHVFGIGLFDFHRADPIIRAGEECAQLAVDQGRLKELAARARRRGRLPRWLRGRP
ncbi:MAG: patatin-like phospholipase family protein [Planctomycetota bacterium]|nr:patatin-like phospholipase family protein [Planctomycetota bacterium]